MKNRIVFKEILARNVPSVMRIIKKTETQITKAGTKEGLSLQVHRHKNIKSNFCQ